MTQNCDLACKFSLKAYSYDSELSVGNSTHFPQLTGMQVVLELQPLRGKFSMANLQFYLDKRIGDTQRADNTFET